MDGEESEDYGDYVTRCICGFTHDDGYMIACDGCSVWQHVECMQVNPNNLPDKYLCEMCEPRTVDRRRARQIQLKKRDNASDDDSPDEGKVKLHPSHLHPVPLNTMKKKKKRGKGPEVKPEAKRIKKEKIEPKKVKKKPPVAKVPHTTQQPSKTSSIQSLLNAASLLEERGQDVWNANTSPWTDKYDPADTNRYTEPVRTFVTGHLSQLKSEAVVYSQEEYCTMEGKVPHPQCGLLEVQRRRKGVVANVGIGEDELVIEYKGKITVKHAVLSDTSPGGGRSLWKHKPCPFVYLYDKISDLDLCIDARHYGNVARFIRRSCSPNSELRHFFVGDDLHFGVYALHSISQGEEITLPFDFRQEKCGYPIECGCGQKATCLVARSIVKKQPQLSGVVTEEEQYGHSRGASRQWAHVVHSEDSNSSWTSTGSRKRSQRRGQLSPARQSSRQASRDVSSESEEETGPDAPEKRRKSREERKTEAVWKMFEKMEASAQRKRQHLYSEGSVDSDTTSSPSALHPLSLPSQGLQKERRGSSSSRKVQMYRGKVRLSSVSSMDALSPAELSETFSPPITPGHAPEAPFTSPPLQSPPSLTSPPPFSPIPKFEVTPYLHPKYLFANFALPRKKAILKQWESEQQRGNMASHPIWANGHIYTVARTNGRQRDRGCLKHRWLKRHGDEMLAVSCQSDPGRSSGKENQRENGKQETKMTLPHKKQVLLRWQTTCGDKDSEPVPSSLEPLQDSRKSSVSSETPRDPLKEVLSSSCNSPLFDDFSDGEEFELSDQERERKGVTEARTEAVREDTRLRGVNEADIEEGGSDEEDVREVIQTRGDDDAKTQSVRRESVQAPLEQEGDLKDDGVPSREEAEEEDSNLSSISDASLVSDTAEKPPQVAEDPKPQLVSSVSDISVSDFEPLETEGPEVLASRPELVSSPVAKEDEPLESEEPVREDSPEADVMTTPPDNRMERAENEGVCEPFVSMESDVKETEMELSKVLVKEYLDSSGLGVQEHSLMREDSLGSGVKEHLLMREDSSGSCSPDARAITSDTPSKAPGKRKINLSEYRTRARRPAEPRKPGPSPPHTSSLFTSSLVVNPSLYYTPGLLATGTMGLPPLMATPTTTTASNVPLFEPVSPDDGEGTPTLVNMEDSLGDLSQQQLPLSATMLVPGYTSNPGLLPTDPGMAQQLPLGSYIPPHAVNQYVLDTRWGGAVPVELAQDPRRAVQGGEMYSHQPMHTQDMPQAMGTIHTGLLPRPGATMVQQPHMIQMMQPAEDPGLIPRPDYRPPRGPMPPRGPPHPYPHHQHRTAYRQGPGGTYY